MLIMIDSCCELLIILGFKDYITFKQDTSSCKSIIYILFNKPATSSNCGKISKHNFLKALL